MRPCARVECTSEAGIVDLPDTALCSRRLNSPGKQVADHSSKVSVVVTRAIGHAMNIDEPVPARPGHTEQGRPAHPNPDMNERERIVDEREAALDERETRSAAREAGANARLAEVEAVLADAETRDDRADARDAVADERERAASLDAFLHADADPHDAAVKARRASATDRVDAKSDRSSSADDRTKLSDG